MNSPINKSEPPKVSIMPPAKNSGGRCGTGNGAGKPKFQEDIDWSKGVLAFMDDSFALKYPQYVSDGDVSVSEEQLKDAVKAAIKLVGWLAKELRAQELSSITKKPSAESEPTVTDHGTNGNW